MKTIDNVTSILCDELKKAIRPGSTISIVAESFSIFAYRELQKQLERASHVRFIFTAPSFVEGDRRKSESTDQFSISRTERVLCNSAFEIRPRNTLSQRELSRKCVEWIAQRVQFKANITMQRMPQFILVDDKAFLGISGFTCTDLGCEQGECMYYNIQIIERSEDQRLFSLFEQLWNDQSRIIDVTPTVLERLTHIFRNNDPDFIYFISIYHIFNEFIQSLDGDFSTSGSNDFATSRIWNMLYEFQSQAAKIILYNLEKYHGTILADSVGLGKTFKEIKNLFNIPPFVSPKPTRLLKQILQIGCKQNSVVLDFFSGSATTAHAVMQLNAEDGGKRKFIMVQLPEVCDEKSEAAKAGYKNICEIGKERIRRAGKKIKAESPLTTGDLDIGFRCLRIDSSNMKDVYYRPRDMKRELIDLMEGNIKPDRSGEDLLFQVMLELGISLSAPITKTTIQGKTVFDVDNGVLLASFDSDLTEAIITEIAKQKPYYFVMADRGYASDSVATNFEQIFETYSADTIRRVL